jgi:uncharacterized protein
MPKTKERKTRWGPLQRRGQCGTLGALASQLHPVKLSQFHDKWPVPTMIRAELLKMLVCPENQSSLSIASSELIAKLNRAIALGQLQNRAGEKLKAPLEGGLLRADRDVLYPIMDDIPMLLVDEGIFLDQTALEP